MWTQQLRRHVESRLKPDQIGLAWLQSPKHKIISNGNHRSQMRTRTEEHSQFNLESTGNAFCKAGNDLLTRSACIAD